MNQGKNKLLLWSAMLISAVAGLCAALYLLLLFFLGLLSGGSEWPVDTAPFFISLIVLVISGMVFFWSKIELRLLEH